MSAQPDGGNTCDRCGVDVGNAGLDKCVVVSDYTEDGLVINYHFCRKPTEDNPGFKECATKVLSKLNLANRKANKQPTGVATPGE